MGQIVDKKQAERLWTFDFVIISLISLFTFLGFHILLLLYPSILKIWEEMILSRLGCIFTFLQVRPLVG